MILEVVKESQQIISQKKNEVIAIEPSQEMLTNAWKDYQYTQIMSDVKTLSAFADKTFDIIICHNVLEYVDNKEEVIKVLTRVLKQNGILSIVKHNRPGRVMQTAVLLDDFEKANAILDGKNSTASKFGTIRYYEDNDITKWEPQLTISANFGIRTFWDLQQNQQKHGDEDWQEKMMQLHSDVTNRSTEILHSSTIFLLKKIQTALNEIYGNRVTSVAFFVAYF